MTIKQNFILSAVFIVSFLLTQKLYAQTLANENIFGNWKCVKVDMRGEEKFSLEQEQKLEKSTLVIESIKWYYLDTSFLKPCVLDHWEINKYDTTHLGGSNLDYTYTKKELSKIIWFRDVDKDGEWACYNECGIFYLKQDTLINVCGGYYLFFVRK